MSSETMVDKTGYPTKPFEFFKCTGNTTKIELPATLISRTTFKVLEFCDLFRFFDDHREQIIFKGCKEQRLLKAVQLHPSEWIVALAYIDNREVVGYHFKYLGDDRDLVLENFSDEADDLSKRNLEIIVFTGAFRSLGWYAFEDVGIGHFLNCEEDIFKGISKTKVILFRHLKDQMGSEWVERCRILERSRSLFKTYDYLDAIRFGYEEES